MEKDYLKKLNKDIKLLKESIRHWKIDIFKNGDFVSSSDCALCKEYAYDNCEKCPIFIYTGCISCTETPCIEYIKSKTKHACKQEILFLKYLRAYLKEKKHKLIKSFYKGKFEYNYFK
jgi:hypothetical protein